MAILFRTAPTGICLLLAFVSFAIAGDPPLARPIKRDSLPYSNPVNGLAVRIDGIDRSIRSEWAIFLRIVNQGASPIPLPDCREVSGTTPLTLHVRGRNWRQQINPAHDGDHVQPVLRPIAWPNVVLKSGESAIIHLEGRIDDWVSPATDVAVRWVVPGNAKSTQWTGEIQTPWYPIHQSPSERERHFGRLAAPTHLPALLAINPNRQFPNFNGDGSESKFHDAYWTNLDWLRQLKRYEPIATRRALESMLKRETKTELRMLLARETALRGSEEGQRVVSGYWQDVPRDQWNDVGRLTDGLIGDVEDASPSFRRWLVSEIEQELRQSTCREEDEPNAKPIIGHYLVDSGSAYRLIAKTNDRATVDFLLELARQPKHANVCGSIHWAFAHHRHPHATKVMLDELQKRVEHAQKSAWDILTLMSDYNTSLFQAAAITRSDRARKLIRAALRRLDELDRGDPSFRPADLSAWLAKAGLVDLAIDAGWDDVVRQIVQMACANDHAVKLARSPVPEAQAIANRWIAEQRAAIDHTVAVNDDSPKWRFGPQSPLVDAIANQLRSKRNVTLPDYLRALHDPAVVANRSQWEIVHVMKESRDAACVPCLIELARHNDDASTVLHAVHVLATFPTRESVVGLIAVLDRNPQVRSTYDSAGFEDRFKRETGDALRKLTGQRWGNHHQDWALWWQEVGQQDPRWQDRQDLPQKRLATSR